MLDSGADIMIICGALLKRIATIAHLQKQDYIPPDRTPHAYDQLHVTLTLPWWEDNVYFFLQEARC